MERKNGSSRHQEVAILMVTTVSPSWAHISKIIKGFVGS